MFLGSKEVLHEKGKYSLIILLITLITFLTFFLSSLADGLATSNKTSLLNLKDDFNGIIIDNNANNNLLASKLDEPSSNVGVINIANSVLKINKDMNNVILMNSNKNIIPTIVQGRKAKNDNEIVISKTIKNNVNLKLNDVVTIDNNKKYKIVGFCKDSQYQTQDVIYVSHKQLTDLKPNFIGKVSGILSNNTKKYDGKYLSIDKLITYLPGYKPQEMTFSMMIGFLIIISAAIIAIFIFILTIQKTELFAVLKTRGYRNGFIARSVISQIIIISLVSCIIALALNVLMDSILPKSMFFRLNYASMAEISILLFISSLLGGIFSILRIRKINPTQALRG